jgi:hypothetical protein
MSRLADMRWGGTREGVSKYAEGWRRMAFVDPSCGEFVLLFAASPFVIEGVSSQVSRVWIPSIGGRRIDWITQRLRELSQSWPAARFRRGEMRYRDGMGW